jgi:hypothetical protein
MMSSFAIIESLYESSTTDFAQDGIIEYLIWVEYLT